MNSWAGLYYNMFVLLQNTLKLFEDMQNEKLSFVLPIDSWGIHIEADVADIAHGDNAFSKCKRKRGLTTSWYCTRKTIVINDCNLRTQDKRGSSLMVTEHIVEVHELLFAKMQTNFIINLEYQLWQALPSFSKIFSLCC